MSGVSPVCDRRIGLPARLKGKIFKTVMRPAVMYDLKALALSKRQEAELEVAQMRILRFALGVTKLD